MFVQHTPQQLDEIAGNIRVADPRVGRVAVHVGSCQFRRLVFEERQGPQGWAATVRVPPFVNRFGTLIHLAHLKLLVRITPVSPAITTPSGVFRPTGLGDADQGEMEVAVSVFSNASQAGSLRAALEKVRRGDPATVPIQVKTADGVAEYRVRLEATPKLVIAGGGHLGKAHCGHEGEKK